MKNIGIWTFVVALGLGVGIALTEPAEASQKRSGKILVRTHDARPV